MAENTREIVLDTLLALERREDFSHRLVKAVLDKYQYLEERDRAFIKRLTEGTVERQIELDYYLDQCSSVPVRKMKPLIRCLMRMSVYQLLYMDNVPDSAVCNEACKLAQKRKFGNLKGFVNGVLRSVARQKESLQLPDAQKDAVGWLSVKYSMPVWIVELWLDEYGREQTERMLQSLLEIHPVSVRFRRNLPEAEREALIRKLQAEGVKLRPGNGLSGLYLAENGERLFSMPEFAAGKYLVQDASSVLAVEAAGIRAGDFVMDICAAPGGKSILAAELVQDTGKVLARDVSEAKTARIEENCSRMGMQNMTVEVWDATVTDEAYCEKADVLLADVPCSGLGVLGKKRDIKYRMTPEQTAQIVKLQQEIIANSWRYVKKGGTLLYSTCTIHTKENEQMARWITERFPFVLEAERQFLPGVDETDGFYYAKFRRTDTE
ncbi:MAG: 16S rRNA (cytosine(967)-C(5))-methyltransferase RsmB [Lachnospiraceae bacterium]|nr:16S rRNA (cytosine(967)-C(5))-methyltransferase RsmB [Lachnospiraceae bacterium]